MPSKCGGNFEDFKDIDPWAKPAATPAVPGAARGVMLKERGIKMSSVIDQSDDSEFIPESLAKADLWYQRYLNTMGGAPQEEEDCTVEQLSALNKRVHTLDLPPYVDLGVWQPYGRRALGASKFRAWFPDGSSGYIGKELPGPSAWGQRLAAWRVFQTAAIMLDILPLASLQLYERHVERLVKLYPSAWHLVVLADEKARGEKWARIRLRISADIAGGKAPPSCGMPKARGSHRCTPWSTTLPSGRTRFGLRPTNAWIAAGGGPRKRPRNPLWRRRPRCWTMAPGTSVRPRRSAWPKSVASRRTRKSSRRSGPRLPAARASPRARAILKEA